MRYHKKITRILMCILLPIMIIGGVIFVGLGSTVQPDNPLLLDSNASMMLPTGGNKLGLSDDFLSNLDDADINKAGISEKVNEDEDVTEDEIPEDVPEDVIENEIPEELGKEKDNSDDNSKPSDNSDDNSKPSDNVGESEIINSNNPGDNQVPSEEESNKVYFTTTIKEGTTIESRDYSFEISHKAKELTVKSETVYVNASKTLQFKGNVFLDEGANIIRVAVVYSDKNSKRISVYKDYKIYVDLGNVAINTDLKNKTVDDEIMYFTAIATFNGKEIPIEATCNGLNIIKTNGKFKINLIVGKNKIDLSAVSGKHSDFKTYTINCVIPEGFAIKTSLVDKPVYESIQIPRRDTSDESFSFTAYMRNGSRREHLYVAINDEPVPINEDNTYKITYKIGFNYISLKATDEVDGVKKSITVDQTIYYIPLATEETVPVIKYINIKDGMTITGNEFKLDVGPVDYKGNRIYTENISVRLNGERQIYEWVSEYTSYPLWFKGGKNIIDIRITDVNGRFADYSYTVYCKTVEDGESVGEITLSIDANVLGLGYIVAPLKLSVIQGETGSYTIARFLEKNGFSYKNTGTLDIGFYLARIKKEGIAVGVNIPEDLKEAIDNDGLEWKEQRYDNSLGEFDYCQGSGWMYSINGSFPNHGFSDAIYKDGDVVCIRFTLAYGKDIGGFGAMGDDDGKNYDKVW